MLHKINKVLAKREVRKIRAELDLAGWRDGKDTAAGHALSVKNNQQIDEGCEVVVRWQKIIINRLNSHPLVISAALPKKIFPPVFNRYGKGQHYGLHADKSLMPTDANTRIRGDISATLFLSEPEEYQGGELVVETADGAREIKLAAGDMVLYPASCLHEVRAVGEGARVACICWIESFIRSAEQRTMLLELEKIIQRLKETIDDDKALIKLILLYHNLVRMWSQ